MKRAWRFAVLAGVFLMTFGVIAGPASATPDNIAQQIRGQGSDTTIYVMESMDRAYNEADGCPVVPTSGTARLDQVCVVNGPPFVNNQTTGKTENWDHDVAISNYPLGSGNGRTLLFNFGNPGYPRIDFARSSSLSTSQAGLRFVAYAQDAIPWATYIGNINAGCDVDRSGGAVFDDNGPLGVAKGTGVNGPGGSAHATWGTWPIPPGGTCPAATAAGSIGGGQVVGGAMYPNVTSNQLKQIFGCATPAINDWQQLRSGSTGAGNQAADVPAGTSIVVWAAQDGSGTRKDYDGKLGSGCSSPAGISPSTFSDADPDNGNRKIFENNATPISGVPNTTSALGGRKNTCESLNRPTQTVADCAGTNTNGAPFSYTQSIFYFSSSQWFSSVAQVTGACTPTCDTTFTGNSLLGQGTILGSINGIDATKVKIGPSCTNPTGGCFPYSRLVYNVYRNSIGTNDAPDWVRDYVGERGWICRPDGAHENDPFTGVNYGTEINNVIDKSGFVKIPDQGTFGGAPVDIGSGVLAPGGTKCKVDF